MELNINNYEMYFLLYADNELCLDEMKIVEDFVLKNPALKKEFEITLSTKILPDEFQLDNKIDLFKFNGSNLQESLLLHLDNEIVENKVSLEELINSDSEINKEWNILNAAKLDKNDEFVFENKNSLYKHETKVFYFRYLKYAVAAVLIGLGLFFGVKLFTNKKVENNVPSIANTNKSSKDILTPGIYEDTEKINQNDNFIIAEKSSDKESGQNYNSNLAEENNNSVKPKDKSFKGSSAEELNKTNVSDDKLIASEKVYPENNIALQENNMDFDKISSERKIATLTANKIETDQVKNIALAAVSNTNNDVNIGHVFIIDQEKINHSKAGGLFNKVKKFVNKTSNLELPEHLTLGNYEIAIK